MQAKQPRELSEPIEGRLHDLINYAVLAVALIQDKPEEGAYPLAVWLFLEGETEGQLVSGYEAASVWRAFNRPWEPATYAGKRILAYRTSTDQPWTPLK